MNKKFRKLKNFSNLKGDKKIKVFLIYSWYSLPDLKHDRERFIRIPLLNIPEMRH